MNSWRFGMASLICLGWLALSGRAGYGVEGSLCGACMPNGVACHDERQYSICYGGVASDEKARCPGTRICTADPIVCVDSALSSYSPACSDTYCGTCQQTGGRFACTGESEYAFCFGGAEPIPGTEGTCPADYVCTYAGAQICEHRTRFQASCVKDMPAEPTESSTVPTTTDVTTTTASTTPSAPVDPNVFCESLRTAGKYPDPSDATCNKYILCILLSGQYVGQRYSCAGYFNADTKKCQTDKPANC